MISQGEKGKKKEKERKKRKNSAGPKLVICLVGRSREGRRGENAKRRPVKNGWDIWRYQSLKYLKALGEVKHL